MTSLFRGKCHEWAQYPENGGGKKKSHARKPSDGGAGSIMNPWHPPQDLFVKNFTSEVKFSKFRGFQGAWDRPFAPKPFDKSSEHF
jgi:hypothetical protein